MWSGRCSFNPTVTTPIVYFFFSFKTIWPIRPVLALFILSCHPILLAVSSPYRKARDSSFKGCHRKGGRREIWQSCHKVVTPSCFFRRRSHHLSPPNTNHVDRTIEMLCFALHRLECRFGIDATQWVLSASCLWHSLSAAYWMWCSLKGRILSVG